MLDYIFNAAPFAIALVVYFVRLEVKLARIAQDLCWIKKITREILRDQARMCGEEEKDADDIG